MFERDLLVAAIAIGLGLALFVSAASNVKWFFEIRTPRYLSDQMGRNRARLILGGIGAVVIFLGVYILFGPKGETTFNAISVETDVQQLC